MKENSRDIVVKPEQRYAGRNLEDRGHINKRNKHIDALKGYAIVLVVLGHAIQAAYIDTFENIAAFRVIYSFHMTLFIFISGFLIYGRIDKKAMPWLARKAKALMIPFTSWTIIIYFWSRFEFSGIRLVRDTAIPFQNYLLTQITNPILWYLPVLLMCYGAIVIVLKTTRFVGDIAFLLSIVAIYLMPADIEGVQALQRFFLFFSIGYLTSKYKESIKGYVNTVRRLSIASFPILVVPWRHEASPVFPSALQGYLGPHNTRGITSATLAIYALIVPLAGIGFSSILVKKLEGSRFYDAFSSLGIITLDIYVIHNLFLNIGLGNGVVRVITIFIASLLISITISMLIRRSKPLRLLLLGIGKNR